MSRPLRALVLSLLLLAPAARAQVMKVVRLEGSATSMPLGQGPALLLREGAPLHQGDVVETFAGSRLEISLATGSVLRVGENSKVALDELAASGRRFRARLLVGNLWAHVVKLFDRGRFEVEAENAVAGVRGTEFTLGRAAGGATLRVYEGTVEVSDAKKGWSHRVEAGEELSFSRRARPQPPRRFDVAVATGDPFLRWARSGRPPPKPELRNERAEKQEPPPKETKAKEREAPPPPPPKPPEEPKPHEEKAKSEERPPRVWDPAAAGGLPARPEHAAPATPAELAPADAPAGGGPVVPAEKAEPPKKKKDRVHERERIHRGQRGH